MEIKSGRRIDLRFMVLRPFQFDAKCNQTPSQLLLLMIVFYYILFFSYRAQLFRWPCHSLTYLSTRVPDVIEKQYHRALWETFDLWDMVVTVKMVVDKQVSDDTQYTIVTERNIRP